MKNDERGKEKEDRISELSDDIICSIITRLSTVDAVRTSVLSRRWRHVYTFTRKVGFFWSKMSFKSPCQWKSLEEKFVHVVDTFLQHHSGSKIMSLELFCPFEELIIRDSFPKWIESIGTLGAEHLILRNCRPVMTTESKRPSDFLGELASSLKRLCLYGISFQSQSRNVGLKEVELNRVHVTAEEVDCILSNCSSLEVLTLRTCSLPSKLSIRGPRDLQLKRLKVSRCSKVAEIDLSAINLITFECCNIDLVMLWFSHVPMLQNVFLEICGRNQIDIPCAFGKVLEDLPPHLKCVFFTYSANFYERFETGEVNNLSNLRRLALFLKKYNRLDLLQLAKVVLDACPLLLKFHLSLDRSFASRSGKHESAAENDRVSCRRHTQLKELEFSGFLVMRNEWDFILYMLENVVSLQRFSIFKDFKSYDLDRGRWLHDTDVDPRYDQKKQGIMRDWLRGHAISNNLQIIIL